MIINESFLNSNDISKKNILPLDLNTKYNNSRIWMANTHQLNILNQAIHYDKLKTRTKIGLFAGIGTGILTSVLLGPIGVAIGSLVSGLCIAEPMYNAFFPLLRQHDARDFALLPTNVNVTEEEAMEISEELLTNPILAINDGIVEYVYNEIPNGKSFDYNTQPAEGNHIVINHYNGKYYSLYAHLYYNSIKVKEGDKVTRGDIIGLLGNTGNSSAPHLHFDISYNNPTKTKYAIGKFMVNFEPYKYTHLDFMKFIKQDIEYFKKAVNAPLEINNTGKLDYSCFIT